MWLLSLRAGRLAAGAHILSSVGNTMRFRYIFLTDSDFTRCRSARNTVIR